MRKRLGCGCPTLLGAFCREGGPSVLNLPGTMDPSSRLKAIRMGHPNQKGWATRLPAILIVNAQSQGL